MMILGGMGSVTGSILGAAIMTILPQFIIPFENGGTVLGVELPSLNGLTQIVTALILIGVMLVKPEGLAGTKEFSWRAMLGLPRAGEGSGFPCTAAAPAPTSERNEQPTRRRRSHVKTYVPGRHDGGRRRYPVAEHRGRGGYAQARLDFSLTGSYATIEDPALKGAKLAVKQVNAAGGVEGPADRADPV